MSSHRSIDTRKLVYQQGIEPERSEFKASWDAKGMGYQVIRTITAFANDFYNLGSGYIVIGLAEKDGRAELPPKGLTSSEIEQAESWIRGQCNTIDPPYQPIFERHSLDQKLLLVIRCPASNTRPHRCKKDQKSKDWGYYVRSGAATVDAEANNLIKDLFALGGNVPFDDRMAHEARIEDIQSSKVRTFLHKTESGLYEEKDDLLVYQRLGIVQRTNGHFLPKNIALLMFSSDANDWFRGARIEVVQFGNRAGDVLKEKRLGGGLHEQLEDALQYLENLSSAIYQKQADNFRVKGWVSYPIAALREALVNAVYHRSYDQNHQPIEVRLYSNRITITSHPGPAKGIKQEHFDHRATLPMPAVPARNRRLGEFLKELRLAEARQTGIPKLFSSMKSNGSPMPEFDFDEDRTYFRVTLPAHPEYVAISTLNKVAELKILNKHPEALELLREAWEGAVGSPTLARELILNLAKLDRFGQADEVYRRFRNVADPSFMPLVVNTYTDLLIQANRQDEAKALFKDIPKQLDARNAIDAAILARRMGKMEAAHAYFKQALDHVYTDARALHEFAQTKIELAKKAHRNKEKAANQRFLKEALEMIERVLQLEADTTRHAWAWRDLAQIREFLKQPTQSVMEAYQKAIQLLPNEQNFKRDLERIQRQHRK